MNQEISMLEMDELYDIFRKMDHPVTMGYVY